MNDNNNEANDITDAESFARAEKIKAIRKAVDSGKKPEDAEIPLSVRSREATPIKPVRLVRKNNNNINNNNNNNNYAYEKPQQVQKKPVNKPKKKPTKKKKKKSLAQKFLELFPQKGDSIFECLRKIFFLIAVFAALVCAYLVADYYIDLWRNGMRNDEFASIHRTYNKPSKKKEEIIEINENGEPQKYYELSISAQKLLDLNPDYIGFITLPTLNGDPVFELPVVQAKDNDEYLHKSFTGSESRAGTLFMDYRNKFDYVKNHHLAEKNSDNIVIYGHNMADDSMFGSLKYYYRNVDYYDNHPIIYFESRYESYTYKIFATFILDAFDKTNTKYDCWNKFNFSDEYDFYKFVNEAKRRTFRTNDVDVKYGDEILTLSTCNTLLGENGRLIVMARKVRDGEDIYSGTEKSKANNNIKWPTMYFQIRTSESYDPKAPFTPYGAESEEEKAELEKKAKEEKAKKDEKSKKDDKSKEKNKE